MHRGSHPLCGGAVRESTLSGAASRTVRNFLSPNKLREPSDAPARRLVGDHHEAEVARLLEHVRDGFARYDTGELDAFDLDDLIHRYKRSARELWKFCSVTGGHAVTVARLLEDTRLRDELPDWWEAGRSRRHGD
jgi:hypothetical protein